MFGHTAPFFRGDKTSQRPSLSLTKIPRELPKQLSLWEHAHKMMHIAVTIAVVLPKVVERAT